MGIVHECFEVYARIVETGFSDFRDLKVMELGAQTVHFNNPEFLSTFMSRINFDKNIASRLYGGMTAEHFHKCCGHEYKCIDFDDLNGAVKPLKWDLNTVQCPPEHLNQYDLVTNYGTTEHCMNQSNSFKLMHDLAQTGAFLINLLPVNNQFHGLFNYNPAFYTALATANRYKMLGLYAVDDFRYDKPNTLEPFHGSLKPSNVYMFAIYRKVINSDFVIPSEIFNNGHYTA